MADLPRVFRTLDLELRQLEKKEKAKMRGKERRRARQRARSEKHERLRERLSRTSPEPGDTRSTSEEHTFTTRSEADASHADLLGLPILHMSPERLYVESKLALQHIRRQHS